MSKFFKALEKAEQDGALRGPSWSWHATTNDPVTPTSVIEPAAPLSSGRQQKGGRHVDPHLVALLTPTAFEAEAYRRLAHQIELMARDHGLRAIAISSPRTGDGKTTIAINLAETLARPPDTQVLLVEAELRRPSMMNCLGDHVKRQGLVDAILDPALSLADVTQPCPPFNLTILPAGRSVTSPYELLAHARMGELLAAARQHYDYVIVDTPPLLPFTDCRLMEQLVDGLLIVVAAHKTPRQSLKEALVAVESDKIIGIVFNMNAKPDAGYYTYHDYANVTRRNATGLRKFMPARRKHDRGKRAQHTA